MTSYPDIQDLAIVGDCRTAALVDRGGNVVWMCAPRFDGPSLFGSLLDDRKGGSFRVAPTGDFEVSRRYVGPTPVLETTFRTPAGGMLRVTDCMPVVSQEERVRRPWPEHQLLRKVECVEGEVDVRVEFQPRPDYGSAEPRLQDADRLGVWCQHGAEMVALLGDFPVALEEDARAASGDATLSAGDTRWLSMVYAREEPAVLLDPVRMGDELLATTVEWWEEWAGRCRYDGPWRENVVRSAVTLKLLTYAPSGAVVAAATTSLPEVEGGHRNWDYRFCWLRDASWTLRGLFELGYEEEARAFYDWIMYATRDTVPDVQAVYDVHGASTLNEGTLEHLAGWRCSRPVRVGNGAHGQLQLDTYGETVVAAFEYVDNGGTLDPAEKHFVVAVAEAVCDRWREKDQGIWEIRGEPKHFTYSKVMCWAALDRVLKLWERGELEDGEEVPVERFRRNRDALRDEIERRAWNEEHDCYRGAYDDDLLDSALLRLPAAGYVKASDERMHNTCDRLVEALAAGDDLFYRYGDGFDDLPGREGAFGLVTFWVAECRALEGRLDEAESLFERMLDRGNDLGLYSEEIAPDDGDFLGNFPQAFTHIGLINAALTLEVCRGDGDPTVDTPWEHQDAPKGEDARHADGRPYDGQRETEETGTAPRSEETS